VFYLKIAVTITVHSLAMELLVSPMLQQALRFWLSQAAVVVDTTAVAVELEDWFTKTLH
jgi:hypothetical protein